MRIRGKLLVAIASGLAFAVQPIAAQRTRRAMAAVPIGDPGSWFPQDDYPIDAIRSNRAGRTVVSVGIDSAGAVVTCTIERTSGTTSLDQKTCELVRQRGSFNPATDTKGQPTASIYSLSVLWVLPDDTQAPVDLSKGKLE